MSDDKTIRALILDRLIENREDCDRSLDIMFKLAQLLLSLYGKIPDNVLIGCVK